MAKRTDQNQRDIVAGLREYGATVLDLHEVGKGCPDLLVGFRCKNYLIEVKSEHGKHTPDEIRFYKSWKGAPTYTVTTLDEAIEIITTDCEDW